MSCNLVMKLALLFDQFAQIAASEAEEIADAKVVSRLVNEPRAAFPGCLHQQKSLCL